MSDNSREAVRCRPEDLRVYLTTGSQAILDTASGAKVRCADLLYTYIDVETHAC